MPETAPTQANGLSSQGFFRNPYFIINTTMAKSRPKKAQEVENLATHISRMKVAVVTSTSGLNVKGTNELRTALRAVGVDYVVAKKTLVKRAFEQAKLADTVDLAPLSESFALSFGYEDEVTPAKTLAKFAKTHEAVKFLGGIMDRSFVPAEQMKALAALPSTDELRARLVGSIASPLSGFVRVLNGNLAGLVRVLEAHRSNRAAQPA